MRTLERDTIDSLTRELAQCADELAFWKYQAVYFHAYTNFGRNPPTEAQEEFSRKYLEKAYKEEERG